MKKVIGKNYLHTHPVTETKLGVDREHCIVDINDLEEAIKLFENNPNLMDAINGL